MYEALLDVGRQVFPQYSCRVFSFVFNMWGCGTVLPLDVHHIALGHLNGFKRRRDLRLL